MSAFLLLAASAPKPLPCKANHSNRSRKSRPSTTSASTAGMTSRTSTRSTTADSSNASSTTFSRDRKVFDPVKLNYVEYDATVSLFEKKLFRFNDAVAIAKKKSICETVDRALNERLRVGENGAQTGERLLTVDNVEYLRFNYFEKFEPNEILVKERLSRYRPAYSHVIAADEQIEAIFSEDTSPDMRFSPTLSLEAVRAKVAAMERKLACPTLQPETCGVSVRDAFHLSSFWDDVYQDIRSESLDEDYYGWLPSRQTTQRFLIELTDFALYRLRMVTCSVSVEEASVLNADEQHELARNHFFYIQRSDTALIECLVAFLNEHFLTQVKAYVVCPDIGRVRELMAVVVASVCENLKLHFYGYSRAESATTLFEDFLTCALEIILLEIPPSDLLQRSRAPPPSQSSTSDSHRTSSDDLRTNAPSESALRRRSSNETKKSKLKFFKWAKK